MTIHINPILSTVRFFDGGSYENKDPFVGVATIQYISDTEAFICGLHGKITKNQLADLFRELSDMGITTVRYERHGKEKVRYLKQ